MATYEVSVDQLDDAILELLEDYNQDIIDATSAAAKKRMAELVKDTKASAPVGHTRRRHFRNYITSKQTQKSVMGCEYTWYVRSPETGLAHLLENGHRTPKGGHTKAFKFIANNYSRIEREYLNDVEKAIKENS